MPGELENLQETRTLSKPFVLQLKLIWLSSYIVKLKNEAGSSVTSGISAYQAGKPPSWYSLMNQLQTSVRQIGSMVGRLLGKLLERVSPCNVLQGGVYCQPIRSRVILPGRLFRAAILLSSSMRSLSTRCCPCVIHIQERDR